MHTGEGRYCLFPTQLCQPIISVRIGTGVAPRPLNGAPVLLGGGLWFCGEGSSLARGKEGVFWGWRWDPCCPPGRERSKTCTSQKRCAKIVTTSLRDICYWFNCNCWKTHYSCRFWALERSSIFSENAHGSSRLYVTSHTCALIWSSCYVRAGACHKYELVHSIGVGWSIHEVRAKQGTRDRSEVGCPARCSATSAAAS